MLPACVLLGWAMDKPMSTAASSSSADPFLRIPQLHPTPHARARRATYPATKCKCPRADRVLSGALQSDGVFFFPFFWGVSWRGSAGLNFEIFEAVALVLTIITVTFMLIASNGQSNWLVGIILISTYLVISMGFWAHRNEDLDSLLSARTETNPGDVDAVVSVNSTVGSISARP